MKMSLFLTVCNILVSTVLLTTPLPPHYRSATPERSRDFNYLKDNWTLTTSEKFLYRFCTDWMNLVEKQDFNATVAMETNKILRDYT